MVTCEGTRTDIPMPLVRAQADGIHIHVANRSGTALDIQIEDASGATLLGETIRVVGGTFIYAFGPGDYRLTCGATGTPFAVVDPDRLFTPSELICADQLAGAVDHAPGATGSRGSLLDIARKELRGLKPEDIVEQAGYPRAAGNQLIRVVRADRVVTILKYADDGHGGWLLAGTRTCDAVPIDAIAAILVDGHRTGDEPERPS
jgi:hypothetical protein